MEEYLDKIRAYLKDIINNLEMWKIQLTIANNFISASNDEERIMYLKSDSLEIMINNEADKVIKELFICLQIYAKIISNLWKRVK